MIIRLHVVKMKWILFFSLVLILPLVSSVAIDSGTIFNTTISNSSVTFSFSVNITSLEIESDYVYLTNVSYANATGLYLCGDLNNSDENTNIDIDSLICNSTVVEVADDTSDSSDSDSSGGSVIATTKPLDKGVFEKVKYASRYSFDYKMDEHFLFLRGIDREAKTITIEINSVKQNILLELGFSKKVDLELDGVFDMTFLLEKIYADSVAVDIRIEEIILEEQSLEDEEVVEDEIIEEEVKSPAWKIFIYLLVIVIVMAILIRFLRDKKRRRHPTQSSKRGHFSY